MGYRPDVSSILDGTSVTFKLNPDYLRLRYVAPNNWRKRQYTYEVVKGKVLKLYRNPGLGYELAYPRSGGGCDTVYYTENPSPRDWKIGLLPVSQSLRASRRSTPGERVSDVPILVQLPSGIKTHHGEDVLEFQLYEKQGCAGAVKKHVWLPVDPNEDDFSMTHGSFKLTHFTSCRGAVYRALVYSSRVSSAKELENNPQPWDTEPLELPW